MPHVRLKHLWPPDNGVAAHEDPRRRPSDAIVVAVATVMYAIISLLLLVATKTAAEAAKRTASVTQRIFEAANRPYLGTYEHGHELSENGDELTITVTIKNFGTTPAHEIGWNWEICVDGRSLCKRKRAKLGKSCYRGSQLDLSISKYPRAKSVRFCRAGQRYT